MLIDGQQRIIALSAGLVGESVIDKKYKKIRIRIAFNPQKERFEVTNPAIQKDKAWIPDIVPVLQHDFKRLKFIKQHCEANPDVDESKLDKVLAQLTGIKQRQIGVIELAGELDIETVTEIFIRINLEGVTFSQADFARSKIAASETNDGNMLRKAIDCFCHLAVAPEYYDDINDNDPDFAKTDYFRAMRWLRGEKDDLYAPSYSDMLRVAFVSQFSCGKLADMVGLLSGRNFETRTYEDEVAKDSFDKLRNGVMKFMNETNFKRHLMMIKSAGFVDSSLLQRRQNALNFGYSLYLKLILDGYSSERVEHYVRRWFVLSLLISRYSG